MAERLVTLNTSFDIAPVDLLAAKRSIPLDGGYVPLRFFNQVFRLERPTFISLGEGAVALSMIEPFGFKRRVEETNPGSTVLRSQKTESVHFAPDSTRQNAWEAIVDTPRPLTELDELLFNWGVIIYAEHAAARLQQRMPDISLDPIPQEILESIK